MNRFVIQFRSECDLPNWNIAELPYKHGIKRIVKMLFDHFKTKYVNQVNNNNFYSSVGTQHALLIAIQAHSELQCDGYWRYNGQ